MNVKQQKGFEQKAMQEHLGNHEKVKGKFYRNLVCSLEQFVPHVLPQTVNFGLAVSVPYSPVYKLLLRKQIPTFAFLSGIQAILACIPLRGTKFIWPILVNIFCVVH